jgi:hypothetical protein
VADLSYKAFLALGTSLCFAEWVALGGPTDRAALAQAAEQSRQRVLESLAKLPVIQDDRGLYLDEAAQTALAIVREPAEGK